MEDAWISLGRGNRVEFAGVLGVHEDGNRKDQLNLGGQRERVLGEMIGIGWILGSDVKT